MNLKEPIVQHSCQNPNIYLGCINLRTYAHHVVVLSNIPGQTMLGVLSWLAPNLIFSKGLKIGMLRQSPDPAKRVVTLFPWPGSCEERREWEASCLCGCKRLKWVIRQCVCTEDGARRRGLGTFTFGSLEAQEREEAANELVREIIRCDCVVVAKGRNSECVQSWNQDSGGVWSGPAHDQKTTGPCRSQWGRRHEGSQSTHMS